MRVLCILSGSVSLSRIEKRTPKKTHIFDKKVIEDDDNKRKIVTPQLVNNSVFTLLKMNKRHPERSEGSP